MLGVDCGHPTLDEVDAGAAEQVGDLQVGQLLTGGGLVQAQPLGELGLRVHHGDVNVVAPLHPGGQGDGRGHAGVSGAEDEDLVHGAAFRFA